MPTLHKDVELTVPVDEEQRDIVRAHTIVNAYGGNILAWCTCTTPRGPQVSLVVEDVENAIQALEAAGMELRIDPVVLVRMPGGSNPLRQFEACLRKAGVGILSSYVTSSRRRYVYVVLKTTDDDRAVDVLTDSLLPAWLSQHETLKTLFLKADALL